MINCINPKFKTDAMCVKMTKKFWCGFKAKPLLFLVYLELELDYFLFFILVTSNILTLFFSNTMYH